MQIKSKNFSLTIGFAAVLSMMVAVFIFTMYQMGENQRILELTFNQNNQKTNLVITMYTAARERSVGLLRIVTMEDPFERDEEYLAFNKLATRFALARIEMNQMNLDEKEKVLMAEQAVLTGNAVPLQNKVVDFLAYDDIESASRLLLDEAIPAQDAVLEQLRVMLVYQQEAGHLAFERSRDNYRNTRLFLGGIVGLALLLGVVIAYVVVRRTDQAEQALRIANETLEERVQDRTRKLSSAYDDLKNSQAQLVASEKMASLGQLTAGIAHEIKNPLNFINNFSVTSVQLLVELREVLEQFKSKPTDEESSKECKEILDMLDTDLGKIKGHGERIDSIISGMLLHARGETGERQPILLNELVDQTVELAFHGEKARRRGFSIRIERHYDPDTGVVSISAQDISRVLVNLVNNGFYATAARQKEVKEDDYEPTLTVVTRNEGDQVKIEIKDNGSGIPETVRDKLFTPFFTTKPPGQGTGLGLSLSYDIIVQQHHGEIEVEDVENGGTCFILTLPRGNVST